MGVLLFHVRFLRLLSLAGSVAARGAEQRERKDAGCQKAFDNRFSHTQHFTGIRENVNARGIKKFPVAAGSARGRGKARACRGKRPRRARCGAERGGTGAMPPAAPVAGGERGGRAGGNAPAAPAAGGGARKSAAPHCQAAKNVVCSPKRAAAAHRRAAGGGDCMRTHCFRLTRGDDLRAAIAGYAGAQGIAAAAVVACVGCLSRARLRDASGVTVHALDEPFEIVSLTGTVSAERLHLHISLAREDLSVLGGHLLEGCVVNTTAEVVPAGAGRRALFGRVRPRDRVYGAVHPAGQSRGGGSWRMRTVRLPAALAALLLLAALAAGCVRVVLPRVDDGDAWWDDPGADAAAGGGSVPADGVREIRIDWVAGRGRRAHGRRGGDRHRRDGRRCAPCGRAAPLHGGGRRAARRILPAGAAHDAAGG